MTHPPPAHQAYPVLTTTSAAAKDQHKQLCMPSYNPDANSALENPTRLPAYLWRPATLPPYCNLNNFNKLGRRRLSPS